MTYTAIDVFSGHIASCSRCSYSYSEAHTWLNFKGTYTCGRCGLQTSVIPNPGIMSSEIIDEIEGKMPIGDFAMPIDEDTMLCRVEGEYYYVKATTEEEALALLRAELTVIKPDTQTE